MRDQIFIFYPRDTYASVRLSGLNQQDNRNRVELDWEERWGFTVWLEHPEHLHYPQEKLFSKTQLQVTLFLRSLPAALSLRAPQWILTLDLSSSCLPLTWPWGVWTSVFGIFSPTTSWSPALNRSCSLYNWWRKQRLQVPDSPLRSHLVSPYPEDCPFGLVSWTDSWEQSAGDISRDKAHCIREKSP